MNTSILTSNLRNIYKSIDGINDQITELLESGSNGEVENVASTIVQRGEDSEINVSTVNTNSIYLETSGGSSAALDYYEQRLHGITFELNSVNIGTAYIGLIRCGRLVTMTVPGLTRTATYSGNGYIVNSDGEDDTLPERFRPVNGNIVMGIKVVHNGSQLPGFVTIANSGTFTISIDASANFYLNDSYSTDNFYGSGSSSMGFIGFSLSWCLLVD